MPHEIMEYCRLRAFKQQTKKREKRRESDQLSKTEARTESSSSRRTKSEISIPPSIDEVKEFFLESESTSKEAENFFNYFESNGWLVGGSVFVPYSLYSQNISASEGKPQ